jgi:hypothetical protein
MFSARDHVRDHGPPGADRHLLRFGCGSELGAVEHCRYSSRAIVCAAPVILRRTVSEESTTPDLVELQKRLTDAVNRRDLDAMMTSTGSWMMNGCSCRRGTAAAAR